ncbi:MAG: oxygenase MpaB family protein [Acidobacteria bacterium]|nr:oxygenase MpaB family protein [Acidobacteriota bacterium]
MPDLHASRLARQVNGEIVVVLGWGRAILLQLAHPLVAAGIADHASFGGSSLQYVQRTHRTISSMLSLTFGPADAVRLTADRINAIHRRVHGRLAESTERFAAGTPYSAADPDLLRWVHVTLIDTQLLTYRLLVGPLTATDADAYCAEAATIAPLLGIPPHCLPTSVADVTEYLERGHADKTVQVTDTARGLARQLLWPPTRVVASPVMALGRLITIGLLPPALRQAYRFHWTERDQRRFDRAAIWLRRTRRAIPTALCVWPASRAGQRNAVDLSPASPLAP